MTVSSFRRKGVAWVLLWLLAACTPATGEMNRPADNNAPIANVVVDRATTLHQRTLEAIEKLESGKGRVTPRRDDSVRTVGLGSLNLRSVSQRPEDISLWRAEEESASEPGVWDGAVSEDVAAILPNLVTVKNDHARQVLRRIAMSAVYAPAGMDGMDYIRWRAVILASDKKFTLAARLMNVVRIGRNSSDDLKARILYQIAAGQTESACIEAIAGAHPVDAPVWQDLQTLCEKHVINAADAEKLRATFLETHTPVAPPAPIADNKEILAKLEKLIATIKDSDTEKDPGAIQNAISQNRGQLLLLALGALSAQDQGGDTGTLTRQAFELVKL